MTGRMNERGLRTPYWTIAVVSALTLAADSGWSQAAAESWGFGYGPNMMGWGWGGMIIMPLFMIAIFVAVIAFIVALVRWLVLPHSTSPGDSAIEILRERFARGEIDKQEFDERRRILRG